MTRHPPKPKPSLLTLGQRLRRMRDGYRETQDQLADAIGVARTTVTLWEADSMKPMPERLEAISQRYNVSVDWLAYGDGVFPAMARQGMDDMGALIYEIIEGTLSDKCWSLALLTGNKPVQAWRSNVDFPPGIKANDWLFVDHTDTQAANIEPSRFYLVKIGNWQPRLMKAHASGKNRGSPQVFLRDNEDHEFAIGRNETILGRVVAHAKPL